MWWEALGYFRWRRAKSSKRQEKEEGDSVKTQEQWEVGNKTLLKSGMGIKSGKVSWKVGAWGPQKAPSGGPGVKPPEAEAF